MSASITQNDFDDTADVDETFGDSTDQISSLTRWMLIGLIAAIIIRPWDFFPPLASVKPVTMTILAITGSIVASGHRIRYFDLPLSRFLLGIWVVMLLGIFNPYSTGPVLDFGVKYVQFLILFGLLGTLVTNRLVMMRVLHTLTIVGIALGSLAMRAKLTGQLSDDGRIEGLGEGMLSDPNDLASMLVTILPLVCYFIVASRSIIDKSIGLFSVLSLLVGIAVTQSRGGLIATLVVGGFLLVVSKVSMPKKWLVVAVVCVVGFMALPEDAIERYASIGSAAQTDESAQSRLAVWMAGGNMFLDHLPIGVGVSNFEVVYGSRYIDRSGAGDVWRSAHNSIVEAAAELGLIGIVCWLGFMIGPIVLLWRARQQTLDSLDEFEQRGSEIDDETSDGRWMRRAVDGVLWSEFMMASILGFLCSAMFLSKAFDISTVIFVGLAVAGHQMMMGDHHLADRLLAGGEDDQRDDE